MRHRWINHRLWDSQDNSTTAYCVALQIHQPTLQDCLAYRQSTSCHCMWKCDILVIQGEWKRVEERQRHSRVRVCVCTCACDVMWCDVMCVKAFWIADESMTQRWRSFKQYNFPLVSQVTRTRKKPSGRGTHGLNRTGFFLRNFQLPVRMFVCAWLHMYSERGRRLQLQ